MKNKTSFNWQCAHCGKRTISTFRYQFMLPCVGYYTVERSCDKCGKISRIGFTFTVEPVTANGKGE